MVQHGDLPARTMFLELFLGSRPVQRDEQLLESEPEVPHQDPRPQGPGGVVLVPDDESEIHHTMILLVMG